MPKAYMSKEWAIKLMLKVYAKEDPLSLPPLTQFLSQKEHKFTFIVHKNLPYFLLFEGSSIHYYSVLKVP
jgi:hypothetical protein